MKRDVLFVGFFLILGVVFGLVFAVTLFGPGFWPEDFPNLYPLSWKAEYEMARTSILWSVGTHKNLLSILFLLLSVVTFAFLLYRLNPNFRIVFSKRAKNLKLWVTIILSLILFFFFAYAFEMPLPAYCISLILSIAMLWLIAGETGWAGDFSSWKLDWSTRKRALAASFFMGGLVGVAVIILSYVSQWLFFGRYLTLVSEVLGGIGEGTMRGNRLLTAASVFMFAFSFGIAAGFVIALTPGEMTRKERLKRLLLPTILLAVCAPVVIGTYWDATERYDLGKQSLAQVIGIPEKAQETRTVLFFNPEKFILQEWPMQVIGSGFFLTGYPVEVTYANMRKIEDYLKSHAGGSVFYYTGSDALWNGYNRLWDVEKGLNWMFQNSSNKLLDCWRLLSRLKYVPVTPDNEKYLREFADETKWYAGKDGAIRIAQAFMHFGMSNEARVWADKAKARGADLSKANFLNEPIFTSGNVNGAIKVNGTPLAETKVALLSSKIEKIDSIRLGLYLVDVKNTDSTGNFAFTNLGKGEYVLAVMTTKETVPYNLPATEIKIENAPRKITLSGETPSISLGTINILTK